MAVWYRAEKTAQAIDAMLAYDGGNTWRGWLAHTMLQLPDAYRTNEKPFRGHMGASGIGDECPRKVWLNFRWATLKRPSPKMLRLFNRGHMEEGRILALLLAIGVKVYQVDANGKQYRISGSEGHYGGSGDGIGINIPDLPKDTPTLIEIKTSKTSDFHTMYERGVKDANFKHYVQMNQYMGGFGVKFCLYVMVCKETDELHLEIVPFDEECYFKFINRAETLVFMPTPPKGIGNSPGFFKCKFCDHLRTCHKLDQPAINCRTCAYSEPNRNGNGSWTCRKTGNIALPLDLQYTGCVQYQKHSGL